MSTVKKTINTNNSVKSQTETWFDEFVATLRVDQTLLETGLASKQKAEMYQSLMSNNPINIAIQGRNEFSKLLVKVIVTDFLDELSVEKCKPEKIAMQLSPSEILVWAIINDNDEATEDALYVAEAKINARCHNLGFHLSTTILEKSDNYPIPEQFSLIPN